MGPQSEFTTLSKEELQAFMADTRIHIANLTSQKPGSALDEQLAADKQAVNDLKGKCLAVSPEGLQLTIPKELFTALTDFMQTRKSPGSITIQFRSGEIICVEAVAKKTYRNP